MAGPFPHYEALSKLIKPLARFCLRRGLKIQDLIEAAKHAFVMAAKEEFEAQDLESNTSRISAATGLQRKDVSRIQSNPTAQPAPVPSLLAAVIGQWQSDRRFLDRSKKTKRLQFEGANSEFAELVRSVSQDLNPYTVLFELERVGAVTKEAKHLSLTAEIFEPKQDVTRGLDILSDDLSNLMAGVDENIFNPGQKPNLHISTYYDNICPEFLPEIREWFLEKGADFHQKARTFLARFDKDLNPALFARKGGATVAVGTFSNTSPISIEPEKEEK